MTPSASTLGPQDTATKAGANSAPNAQSAQSASTAARPSSALSAADQPEEAVPVRRVGRRRAAGPARPAANDDVPSIGGLIYALQQKPSRRPFTVAAVMTGGWLLVGLIITWFAFSGEFAAGVSFTELLTRPQTTLIVAALLLPVA
ncbi:MAG: hypothetical protein AAFQ42_10210, partial [Pseudomonadota bacterium]